LTKRLHTGSYALGDFIAAMIAWTIFYSIQEFQPENRLSLVKSFYGD